VSGVEDVAAVSLDADGTDQLALFSKAAEDRLPMLTLSDVDGMLEAAK
jgi:hypothetical protein